jgi:hypothetical protein
LRERGKDQCIKLNYGSLYTVVEVLRRNGLIAARMGPPMLQVLPRWLLESFTRKGMAREDQTAKPGDVTLRQFAPTLRSPMLSHCSCASKSR